MSRSLLTSTSLALTAASSSLRPVSTRHSPQGWRILKQGPLADPSSQTPASPSPSPWPTFALAAPPTASTCRAPRSRSSPPLERATSTSTGTSSKCWPARCTIVKCHRVGHLVLYNYLLGVPVVFMGYLLPGVVPSIIHPLRVRETGKYCLFLLLLQNQDYARAKTIPRQKRCDKRGIRTPADERLLGNPSLIGKLALESNSLDHSGILPCIPSFGAPASAKRRVNMQCRREDISLLMSFAYRVRMWLGLIQ